MAIFLRVIVKSLKNIVDTFFCFILNETNQKNPQNIMDEQELARKFMERTKILNFFLISSIF